MMPVACCPLPSDKRLRAKVERAREKYIAARTQALALIRTRPLDDIGREDAVWAALDARQWYWRAVRKRERVAEKRIARRTR